MKKGFTLVEIMAVIAILGLLVAIAVPSVLKVSKNMRKNMYCDKLEIIEKAAEIYGEDNNLLNSTKGCEIDGILYPCIKKTVGNLLSEQYLEADEQNKIINPIDKTSMNNKEIYIYYKNNRVYAHAVSEATNKCSDLSVDYKDAFTVQIKVNNGKAKPSYVTVLKDGGKTSRITANSGYVFTAESVVCSSDITGWLKQETGLLSIKYVNSSGTCTVTLLKSS